MNVVRFIKSKICPGRRAGITDDGYDLRLYRQLRHAERKLHETRERLQRKLSSQHFSPDESVPGTQEAAAEPVSGAGEPRGLAADGSGRNPAVYQEQLQQEIGLLQRDVTLLEADYQHAQMNVRAYFYLDAYPGRLTESDVTAGHSPQ